MMRPVHFEILADDPQKVADFYNKVFDWEIATWEGPQTYWLATTGEDAPGINGAFMGRHFDQAVINTIDVPSLDAAMEAVKQQGGEVLHGPAEIPGVGTHAYCADIEGILFGILQSEEPESS